MNVRHAPSLSRLTPHQLRVLKLMCEGLTAKEIGWRLKLAQSTVQRHQHNIRVRLQLNSTQAVVLAIRSGLGVAAPSQGEENLAGNR